MSLWRVVGILLIIILHDKQLQSFLQSIIRINRYNPLAILPIRVYSSTVNICRGEMSP